MSKLEAAIAAIRKRDAERATKQPTLIDLRSRTMAADLSSSTPIVGTSTTERKP